MGTLHKDVFTFVTISCWILLRMRNVSNTSCKKKPKTHILCSVTFFRKSCNLWDIVEKRGGARGTAEIWRMRVTCWISKVTSAQAQASARAPTSTHARTHRRARAHTHAQKSVIPTCEILGFHCSLPELCRLLGCDVAPTLRNIPEDDMYLDQLLTPIFYPEFICSTRFGASPSHHQERLHTKYLRFIITTSVSLYASCCRSYKVF